MTKDTNKDRSAKEKESAREIGGSPTRPATHKLVKDVGMVKGESAKTESPAYKAGVEMGKGKREPGRKGK